MASTLKNKLISMFCMTLALTAMLSAPVAATLADDEKECAEQLTNLAACIPFVSGSAKQPTKECCDDTEKLRSVKPKCLCVLIKESGDPSMGLPINTTLALQMPAACKSDAKVSDCPTLLNIPADSPDAKIFKIASADSSTTSSSTSTSTTSDSSTASTKPSSSSPATASPDTKTTGASTNNGAKIASSALFLMGLASMSLIFL